MDQLLWGWLRVRHGTVCGSSFGGGLVVLMLYAHGAWCKPSETQEDSPCQFTALDLASGVFVNVHKGCTWYLASTAVACESGVLSGWEANFVNVYIQPAQVLNRFCPQTVKNKIITLCFCFVTWELNYFRSLKLADEEEFICQMHSEVAWNTCQSPALTA